MNSTNPFSESKFRRTYKGLALREGLRLFASDADYTHWVTLNTNADVPIAELRTKLRHWSTRVIHRLFRSTCFTDLSLSELLHFIAFLEYTEAGHPHLHIVLYVHPDRKTWFERIAPKIWKGMCHSGNAYIEPILSTESDHVGVATYATKYADRSFSHDEFWTSNMLDLSHTRSRRQRHALKRTISSLGSPEMQV